MQSYKTLYQNCTIGFAPQNKELQIVWYFYMNVSHNAHCQNWINGRLTVPRLILVLAYLWCEFLCVCAKSEFNIRLRVFQGQPKSI